MAATKKRTSGPTQPEHERKNPQIKLRLRPERTAEIRALAREYDVTASAVVDTAMAVALRSGDLVAVLSLAALASGGRE